MTISEKNLLKICIDWKFCESHLTTDTEIHIIIGPFLTCKLTKHILHTMHLVTKLQTNFLLKCKLTKHILHATHLVTKLQSNFLLKSITLCSICKVLL